MSGDPLGTGLVTSLSRPSGNLPGLSVMTTPVPAAQIEIRGRLVTSDLLDSFLALMAEVQQQRLHELLVQQMTRAVPVAVRVARNPLLEGHLALHFHRVILNVNKCLMILQNSHLMMGDGPKPDKCFGAVGEHPIQNRAQIAGRASFGGGRAVSSFVSSSAIAAPKPCDDARDDKSISSRSRAGNVPKGGSHHMRHPARRQATC